MMVFVGSKNQNQINFEIFCEELSWFLYRLHSA